MTPRTASGGPVCVKERKPDKEHVARTPEAVAKFGNSFSSNSHWDARLVLLHAMLG